MKTTKHGKKMTYKSNQQIREEELAKRHKVWLSQEYRLDRWNHLRERCGLKEITLEEAAAMMCNAKIETDIKEYLE